ncbi:adenylate/guanylate cyclase domain-containing protein [Sneathiella chinensis]|uniref:Guanylate cyclase domain-containing protein n=1 Tax=Sneathiella chinensis TaxID=349750 RepID=A0ABQ5U2T6_9PROT|nr:adenylate/guanylate cyclase domain-containing protein [Sneathiella chinensis]GLQ05975.1 hypothetical protein GCM10007924_11960 [Sneathiella chinensis]
MTEASLSGAREKVRIFDEEDIQGNRFLDAALEENKREGLFLAIKARTVTMVVVGFFLVYLMPDWSVLYYEVLLGGFIVNGFAQLKVGRVGRSKLELALMFLDLALLTLIIVVPNPFKDEVWSVALMYKYGNFPYFFIFLAAATLAYSWKTLFAVAGYTTILWLGAFFWAASVEDPIPELTAKVRQVLDGYPEILPFVDLNYIVPEIRYQEALVFVLVAGILALNSWRSKRLLVRQASAARERANLARHFAPTIVDHLAERDQPLGEVREQDVVVMFVDIVGFTKMAENQDPERVVTLLRQFHARMETAVFEFHGTLDKFLGDGLMATFGTPDPSPEDADNAIACAVRMQTLMDEWNAERAARGEQPVILSIGLHAGVAILGDIGSERRLEYAVLGDVVNVASRLESLTRQLGASVVVSDDVIQKVSQPDMLKTSGLQNQGAMPLRGREEPVSVWMRPRP